MYAGICKYRHSLSLSLVTCNSTKYCMHKLFSIVISLIIIIIIIINYFCAVIINVCFLALIFDEHDLIYLGVA